MAWHQSLVTTGTPDTMEQAAKLLFGIMSVGDDRNVDETWIAGKRAYSKSRSVDVDHEFDFEADAELLAAAV